MKKFALALPLCLLGWATASAAPAEELAWSVEYPQAACSEIVSHSLPRSAGGSRPTGLSILCKDAAGQHAIFTTRDLPRSGWFSQKTEDVDRVDFIPGDVNTLRVRRAE